MAQETKVAQEASAEIQELQSQNNRLQAEIAELQRELADATSSCNLVECPPGDIVNLSAASQLRSGWAKKEAYELGDVISVYRIDNPYLEGRYNTYKNTLIAAGVPNGGETLVYHGCTQNAMDPANPDSIIRKGFLKVYWKTSAGDWQRFGPGFDQPCRVLQFNEAEMLLFSKSNIFTSALHALAIPTTCLYMMHRSRPLFAVRFISSFCRFLLWTADEQEPRVSAVGDARTCTRCAHPSDAAMQGRTRANLQNCRQHE